MLSVGTNNFQKREKLDIIHMLKVREKAEHAKSLLKLKKKPAEKGYFVAKLTAKTVLLLFFINTMF